MWTRRVFVLVSILLGAAAAQADSLSNRLEAELLNALVAATTEDAIKTLAIVEGIYRDRDMRPFWIDETGIRPQARQLSRLLLQADLDALDPNDYGAGEVSTMIAGNVPEDLAELEVRLSLGLAQFVSDLGQGRTTPHVADPELFLFRDEVDKAAILSAAGTSDDLAGFIDRFRPQSPRYQRLRAALADYRAMAELGGWPPIPDGPALKPGMTDPRVALVRTRLSLWGDLPADADSAEAESDPDFYDDALAVAVERMQHRHGLEQDGVVGRNTLAAFNVSVEDRIDQLVVNLERRRWMPDDLGERYIYVNLADFNLKLVDGGQTIHETRVVVGRPYHRTPVFSHEMTYVVVNPFWHVPPSIARNELLPKIREDAGYLAANDFTLLSDWSANAVEVDPHSVDWSTVEPSDFGYKIRQGPGDSNALGRLKFMFPNHFNIYMHDTPSRSLFARAQRSFSHGCIRVMEPERLAEIVLSGSPGWSLERINDIIDGGSRTVASLPEPLPVHLSYQTAWVNKDGSAHFRTDIYDRDMELAEALMGSRRGRNF